MQSDLGLIPGWERSHGERNGNPSIFLAWRIPWIEEPGWLQSMGLQELGMTQQLNQHLKTNISQLYKILKVKTCKGKKKALHHKIIINIKVNTTVFFPFFT